MNYEHKRTRRHWQLFLCLDNYIQLHHFSELCACHWMLLVGNWNEDPMRQLNIKSNAMWDRNSPRLHGLPTSLMCFKRQLGKMQAHKCNDTPVQMKNTLVGKMQMTHIVKGTLHSKSAILDVLCSVHVITSIVVRCWFVHFTAKYSLKVHSTQNQP